MWNDCNGTTHGGAEDAIQRASPRMRGESESASMCQSVCHNLCPHSLAIVLKAIIMLVAIMLTQISANSYSCSNKRNSFDSINGSR